jgi:phosphohistidine phosphatase SixA
VLELLLLRHGEAAYSLPDAERPLTERGIVQTQQVLERRRPRLQPLDHLFCSPYLRARQTAALVGEQLDNSPKPEHYSGLQPDASVSALIDWLQPLQGRVLLVGHNPLLTRLINRLTGEPHRYQFDTSTLASLQLPVVAAGCAELNWMEFA